VASIWLLPESPRQLFASGKVTKAIHALNRIAQINKSKGLPENLARQLGEVANFPTFKEQEENLSVCETIRREKVCLNLFVMVSIAMTVAINYYLISFLVVSFEHPYM